MKDIAKTLKLNFYRRVDKSKRKVTYKNWTSLLLIIFDVLIINEVIAN